MRTTTIKPEKAVKKFSRLTMDMEQTEYSAEWAHSPEGQSFIKERLGNPNSSNTQLHWWARLCKFLSTLLVKNNSVKVS